MRNDVRFRHFHAIDPTTGRKGTLTGCLAAKRVASGEEEVVVVATAKVSPNDQPRKAMGRHISLSRLHKFMETLPDSNALPTNTLKDAVDSLRGGSTAILSEDDFLTLIRMELFSKKASRVKGKKMDAAN